MSSRCCGAKDARIPNRRCQFMASVFPFLLRCPPLWLLIPNYSTRAAGAHCGFARGTFAGCGLLRRVRTRPLSYNPFRATGAVPSPTARPRNRICGWTVARRMTGLIGRVEPTKSAWRPMSVCGSASRRWENRRSVYSCSWACVLAARLIGRCPTGGAMAGRIRAAMDL